MKKKLIDKFKKKKKKERIIKAILLFSIILPVQYLLCFAVFSFSPLLFSNNKEKIQEDYSEVIELAKQSNSNLLNISDNELLKKGNTLIIPILGIEMPISGGDQDIALHNGIWHDERSATPPLIGNTVLSGHRYFYGWLGDAFNKANYSLYELNLLEKDDLILVIWDHKIYRYFVTTVTEINTNDLELLQESDKSQITIYTCTPLPVTDYSKRLVVIGK